jgi:hypothetical protein
MQMRELRRNFVSDGSVLRAVRDLRVHLAQVPVLVALLAAAVVLGLSGPFGTYGAMPAPARFAYWTAVVAGTYVAGNLTSQVIRDRIGHLPLLGRVALAGAGSTLTVTAVLVLIATVIGRPPHSLTSLLQSAAGVYAICLCFEAVGEAMGRPLAAPAPPRLLARLPLDRRGRLVALSSADHYVTVVTARGRAMLLMRLSDAMGEAAPTPGLQVHRSHWVALAAIRAVRRQGDGAIVTLQDGTEVPVSRGFLPAVQAAGLLPRKGA